MNSRIKKIALIGIIGGIYTGISLIIAPLAYGPIQIRLSESLTLLPAINIIGIYGVTLGCFLTNLVGAILGLNILGFVDVFVGTLATFIAAYLSFLLRNKRIKGFPVYSSIPPILVNAVIIGLELMYVAGNGFDIALFALMALYVGVGQLVSLVFGLLLFKYVEKVFNNYLNQNSI